MHWLLQYGLLVRTILNCIILLFIIFQLWKVTYLWFRLNLQTRAADRVNNVYKIVNTPLGREVIKKKTDKYGEKELPTEHLLGENLAEKNKKAWESARAADTVMNTSLSPKKWRKQMTISIGRQQ